jgi:hypothetical protein
MPKVARLPTADASTLQTRDGEGLAEGSHPVAMWARRATLTAMALVVAADLLSLLGVHTSSVSAADNGYAVTLHYPSVARAGLDTPWQATVTHPGGFGKELTLAVTGSYFNIFETQGFHPNPSAETRDGQTLYLTFTAPPGDTFVVDFDAYIQPASQQGRTATLTVIDGGVRRVSVDFHTRLMP